MVLPAMNILGGRLKTALVLGGGTGCLARYLLQWPSLEKVVVVEADENVVEAVQKGFPHCGDALKDSRTKIVFADAFQWIASASMEQFDLVLMNLQEQPWTNASRLTRVPRTRGFYRRVKALVSPGGLVVQNAGSSGMPNRFAAVLSVHRQVFASAWPMAYGSLSEQPTHEGDAFDGRWFRPPCLALMSSPDDSNFLPTRVDWSHWSASSYAGPTSLRLAHYHPLLHNSLFVLPAAMQQSLNAKPPQSLESDVEELEPEAKVSLVHTFETEAHGCSDQALDNLQVTDALLKHMAAIGELTVLGELQHKFEPQGLTAVLVVSESHLSIHTWPELAYAVLDVVSCKPITPAMRRAMKAEIALKLGCSSVTSRMFFRGKGMAEEATYGAPVTSDKQESQSKDEL